MRDKGLKNGDWEYGVRDKGKALRMENKGFGMRN